MSDKESPKRPDLPRKRKRLPPSGADDRSQQASRPRRPFKRQLRARKHSSSSDSGLIDVDRARRSMDKLFLHPGKLRVFQAYFNDPRVQFCTRPERRRRHPAGSGLQEPVQDDPLAHVRERQPVAVLNQAGAVVGYVSPKSGKPAIGPILDQGHSINSAETAPIHAVYEGNFSDGTSSRSSRGMSSGSFPSFHSGPDPNPEPRLVPFEGLDATPSPLMAAAAPSPEIAWAASRDCPGTSAAVARPAAFEEPSRYESPSSVDLDEYMASESDSEEEEMVQPMPDLNVDNMEALLRNMNFPPPEPMRHTPDPSSPSSAEQDDSRP